MVMRPIYSFMMILSVLLLGSAAGMELDSPATIFLTRALHFTDPQGRDVVVARGTYRIEQPGELQLRLVPEQGDTVTVQASGITHEEMLVTPVAAVVPSGDDTVSIVLLLPNGNGLQVGGSFSAVRSRAGATHVIGAEALRQALRVSPLPLPTSSPGDQSTSMLAFCEQLKQDPNFDRDPSKWLAHVEMRKVEYQLANIREQVMSSDKISLMLNRSPKKLDDPSFRIGPTGRDDMSRLVARIFLANRGIKGVWPWERAPELWSVQDQNLIRGWWFDQIWLDDCNPNSKDDKPKCHKYDPRDNSFIQPWLSDPDKVPSCDPAPTASVCRKVNPLVEMSDSADMGANERIRLLYLLPSPNLNVPAEVRDWIKASYLKFKFWIDEPLVTPTNKTEMTFWSENHQILFATTEYLAGQAFPDDVFRDGQIERNPSKNGQYHREKAKRRILRWLDEHLKFGFNEWNSPGYIAYDFLPLLNLVDFAPDPEIQTRAAMVLDLLFFDLARLSQRGNFGVGAQRAYAEHKITGWDQNSGDLAQIVFGMRCPNNPIYLHSFGDRYWNGSSSPAHAFASSRYRVPTMILALGHDQLESGREVVDRARVSIEFDEAEDHGIGFDNFEDGMFWWAKNAYFTKYTIRNSLEMVKAYGNLEGVGTPLVAIGIAQGVSNLLNFVPVVNVANVALGTTLEQKADRLSFFTEGLALTKANLYAYRNEDVSLTSVQNWRKGQISPQLQAWQATFDNDVVVFSTYPLPQGTHDGPSYWTGNAVNPRIIQYQDAAIIAYAPAPVRLQQAIPPLAPQNRTHVWWPKDKHVWVELDKDDNQQPKTFKFPDSKTGPKTYLSVKAKNFDAGPSYVELAAQGKFDLVEEQRVHSANVDGVWYFGQKGNGYIGLFSAQHDCGFTVLAQDLNKDAQALSQIELAPWDNDPQFNVRRWIQESTDWGGKEIICNGLRNIFIVQVGNKAKFGSFESFRNQLTKARINISKGVREPVLDATGLSDVEASYDIPNPKTGKVHRLELHYDQDDARLDGKPYCNEDFPRYERSAFPYSQADLQWRVEWGQRRYTIQLGSFRLFHDIDTGERRGDGI
jgi:hypothetical protein